MNYGAHARRSRSGLVAWLALFVFTVQVAMPGRASAAVHRMPRQVQQSAGPETRVWIISFLIHARCSLKPASSPRNASGISIPAPETASAFTYEYDANGLRTKQVTPLETKKYLLDGASVFAEYDAANALTARYMLHPQVIDEILSFETGGATYWPLTDALGSVVAISDAAGAVVRSNSYSVDGERTTTGVGPPLAFGFTGREHDPSGQRNHRDRYADALTGRWSQPDRLGMVDGPNLYQYVGGNPISVTDPSGQIGTAVLAFAVRNIGEEIWIANLPKYLEKSACETEPEMKALWLTYAAMSIMYLAVLVSRQGGGYESFSAFKRANGAAGVGKQWHHVVGQHATNLNRFGAKQIHNVRNIVAIPEKVHRQVSGYYSSIRRFTNGKTVREWAAKKSFDDQYEFGLEVVSKALKGLPLP